MMSFINRHKIIRRLALIWACAIITVVVLRVTEPEIIVNIGAAGATIVTAVIGMLATILGLYQHQRGKQDGG